MKKHFNIVLLVALFVIFIVFIVVCYLKSIVLHNSDIVILLFCGMLGGLIHKSKKMKSVTKFVMLLFLNTCVVLYCIFVSVFTCREFCSKSGNDAVNVFENITVDRYADRATFNPFVNMNKNYETVDLYQYRYYGLWEDSSCALVLKYSDIIFTEAKKDVEYSFSFFEQPIDAESSMPIFEYNGFDFQIVNMDCLSEYLPNIQYYDYPKYVYLVGVNNQSKEIAYIIFNNNELDVISDYNDFLLIDCGWKYIERSRNNVFFNIFYSN